MSKDQDSRSDIFVPYIPSSKSLPEITLFAVILGIILAIVFGAANAYLGLVVGMTVSASIPSAVISMGVLRGIFRRNSILENNIVQTMTTAGEAAAGGAVFTIPALFLWGMDIHVTMIAFIVIVGGLLGVLMMVPLRRLLIVKEHDTLPYPEGTACAEVLKTGEEGGTGALTVLKGFAIGGLFKALGDGLMLFKTEIETGIYRFKNAIVGMDTFPALLGVGYIIGPSIAGQMIAGGLLAWVVMIPMIGFFGSGNPNPIFPSTDPLPTLDAWGIWDNYIRYIGAGAVAAGGIISLLRTLPILYTSLRDTMVSVSQNKLRADGAVERIDKDLAMKWIIGGSLLLLIIIAINPVIHVGLLGAFAILVLGFLFVTVSSRLVGVVGTSSDPISGMTIATLLIVTLAFKVSGFIGTTGMLAALGVSAIVCVALAVSGDISQDLKTGFLVGSTPWKQQVGMMIGVLVSGLVIGWILIMLDDAYGMGTRDLPAPKAVLMKILVQGLMEGKLPWDLIFIGVASAIVIEFLGLNSLVVAVGIYLPIHTSAPIMIGGAIRWLIDRSSTDHQLKNARIDRGILYASGLIAGESLIGVVIALLIFLKIPIPGNALISNGLLPLILFLLVCYTLWHTSFKAKREDRLES
ncbi:oligopeptide transporter, OPT family protein [Pullulanibacillus camelliae]|uniref:Oligopeptide transporter, OPT family protein n=1 Tax=Pullulanibacillus camelliae TaxID=1707096 RepID=A0A8J2YIP6_9BACL|nr:oligopeptide transporter, OPT family [Pullulanibacillus camelliae]GGE45561.1 oligopeptide transporter, OPT family protein [Pullulanibacillus camelliae]